MARLFPVEGLDIGFSLGTILFSLLREYKAMKGAIDRLNRLNRLMFTDYENEKWPEAMPSIVQCRYDMTNHAYEVLA